MATIRDIAALAEVSIASVSRILNNDVSFNTTEATRQKVFDAARKLNYQYSPNRKKRKQAASNSIVCIHRLTPEKQVDSYYASILHGIQSYLEQNGYSLDFVQSQFDVAEKGNLEALFRTPRKGLILMDAFSEELTQFIRSKVKHIVGIDTENVDIDNVRYNRFEAGCKAMQYLIDNGHKKIAYVGSNIPHKNNLDFGRSEAYVRMMKANGFPVRPEWIIDCEWKRQTCFDKTLNLLKSEELPTAIFVGSDHMAISCIAALHQAQLSIPDDISVIGISNIEGSAYLTPPLTTVAVPQIEMGEIAAEALLSRINGNSTVAKQIFVPTKLIVRQSVKKIN